MDLIGKTLGQYHIVEPLGRGGMAMIFKAHQPTLDRYVAIKVLPAQHALTPGFSERFVREARAIAQLNHPNILPIYDFGQEGDLSYIVMKLVSGGTLKERLDKPLDLAEAARLVEQIAAALDHAHERGVLHRDVKPSNVLLDEADWVQLADFGLAKIVAGDDKLTGTGAGIGTPAYMSPEQGQGRTVDHRTDVYSLGVILYEMVTGRTPYQAATPLAVMLMHIQEPLPLPSLLNPDLPQAIEAVILQATAKTPNERYPSAGELARALQAAVTGQTASLPVAQPVDPLTGLPSTVTYDRPPHPTPFMGVSEMGVLTPEPFTPQLALTPPPEPTRPPEMVTFVGRETELAYYADKLTSSGMAIISGMAGVGKTALATALAQQVTSPEQIFWHAFHEGEGVDALLWRLAGFLAWRGQGEVWRMLQGAQETGGQPPPIEVLFDYLFQTLRAGEYLLCLDDFQFVDDAPMLTQLVERLGKGVETGGLSLIITSRRIPDFVSAAEFETLSGLSAVDADRLLAIRGVSLSQELTNDLYTHTEGNAELLTLAIETLRQARDPAHVIARLAETDDIERYLMNEVDEGLNDEEREVMSAVATLLGYPGTRDAIEAVLDSGGVRRTLSELSQRYLLTASQGEWGREYGQHALLQAFYYDLLGRRERQEMHCRAGEFYELEEPNALKAARHYQRGGEVERAAELATEDVWVLINQGQAQALRRVLERFRARGLDKAAWAKVNLSLGEVCGFLGQREQSKDSYEKALSTLEALPVSDTVRELRARVCRGLSDLVRYESPQEAMERLERGLEILGDTSTEEKAALLLKMSTLQLYVGDYQTALGSVQQSLELFPEGPSWLRVGALMNLGNIQRALGDVKSAIDFALQALEIGESLHDHFRLLAIWNNLGNCKLVAGDSSGAIEAYQQALKLAKQLGNITYQVPLGMNLGFMYTRQADYALATEYLTNCLSLARSNDLHKYEITSQQLLADLHLHQGKIETAAKELDRAKHLASKIDLKDQLVEIYRGLAQVQLAKGDQQTALEYANQSINLAHELQMSLEKGSSLRVLAQVFLVNGQPQAALETFEQSLSLLEDKDPYEAARTKTQWGLALVSKGDAEGGTTLLKEARTTFAALGAKRDLVTVDELLRDATANLESNE